MRCVIALLAVAGIVVSSLAFQVHYSNALEPCDINSHWDCGIVNHSSFSTVNGLWWHLRDHLHPGTLAGPAPRTGLPVAAVGIIGYAAIALLAFFRRRWWLILFSLGALGFALYLSNIEAHVLEVWCLYCVISQCVIALITLLSIVWLFFRPRRA
jgi:vitamin-K-epoxide reductase (warfarin-sensitive)